MCIPLCLSLICVCNPSSLSLSPFLYFFLPLIRLLYLIPVYSLPFIPLTLTVLTYSLSLCVWLYIIPSPTISLYLYLSHPFLTLISLQLPPSPLPLPVSRILINYLAFYSLSRLLLSVSYFKVRSVTSWNLTFDFFKT